MPAQSFEKGYPEPIQYLKLAESTAAFSQTGQYNFGRALKRQDHVTVQIMLSDCLKAAAKLCHYMENRYPPHDKWLVKGLDHTGELLQKAQYAYLTDEDLVEKIVRLEFSAFDKVRNTSYETYLRGKISTYSDKMLELYGRYVVEYARTGENLTSHIMRRSVEMYGYRSLKEAEEQLGRLRK